MKHTNKRLYTWATDYVKLEGSLKFAVALIAGATITLLGGLLAVFGTMHSDGLADALGFGTWAVGGVALLTLPITAKKVKQFYYLDGLTRESRSLVYEFETLPKSVQAEYPNFIETVKALEDANNGGFYSYSRAGSTSRLSPQGELEYAVSNLVAAERAKEDAFRSQRLSYATEYGKEIAERMNRDAQIAYEVKELA